MLQPNASSEMFEHADTDIADLLRRAARRQPSSGIIFSGRADQLVNYRDLLDESLRILDSLQARGLTPGANVALLLDHPWEFVPTFWACILGGYIPSPLAPIRGDAARWANYLAHINTLLDQPLFVCTASLLEELPSFVERADLAVLRDNISHGRVHHGNPTDVAVLMLTSGSTGNAKAVELTHDNLLASMKARAARQQVTASDVMLNWIAFDHVAALLESHMIALYAGATQVHAEPVTILADPLQFLRLIDRHRVSIAFAPNFLLGQINAALERARSPSADANALRFDLTCLRRIVTGGEANVVATGRRFLELLAPHGLPHTVLWPAFGMTETCAACVYSHEFPDRDVGREFASVGLPIDGLTVRIADERGTIVPDQEVGELQLCGPMIFRRYHNNEDATRNAFTGDGWFRTGDLGRMSDGRLSLIARSKDSIVVSGVNYFGLELETELERMDGIERSFVAAFPTRSRGADTEQLVVTFAVRPGLDDEVQLHQLVVAVRNTTIMLWGFRPTEILALPKDVFPKTSLGKIQRSLMRSRYEAGAYETESRRIARVIERQFGPYVAPRDSTESEIAEIFARVLGIDAASLSATISFFDFGGTSLDIHRLTHALERRFETKLSVAVILQNPTVRKLAAYLSVDSEATGNRYQAVVPLQTTGHKTPLFCVHPGNGEIVVLVNLSKYFLNDRPFYALRPRGFGKSEDCFATFDEIVATYVDAIVETQPHGPYAIAGYSLGFTIAFDVAKALESRGETVAFLGCIDWRSHPEPTPMDYAYFATSLGAVLGLYDREQAERLRAELSSAAPGERTCEYILSFASGHRLAELNMDVQRFATWAHVGTAMEKILLAHVTSGQTNSLTVFRSAGFLAVYSTDEWHEKLRRWDMHARHVDYVDVPGDHYTLMFPKHVSMFQAILRARIDRALSMYESVPHSLTAHVDGTEGGAITSASPA